MLKKSSSSEKNMGGAPAPLKKSPLSLKKKIDMASSNNLKKSPSSEKNRGASAKPSTVHLRENSLFNEWISYVNQTINMLLSQRKRPLKLEFSFINITNFIIAFTIEVNVDNIVFNDNLDIYITKTNNLNLAKSVSGDKIFKKYYITQFSNMKIDKEELFRNGYLIDYHDKIRLHNQFGELIAEAINTANSVFYDKYWRKPKNYIELEYKQSSSFYFTNEKHKSQNQIYKKLPRSYPPHEFRSTPHLIETGRRVGIESGVGKTHIVCKHNFITLTIYQTTKYLVENEVFFNRGKFVINPLRIDKYYDNIDVKNKLNYEKWVKYLDDYGYSARADVVFYNAPFIRDTTKSNVFDIDEYTNYMLQHDIDKLIDYFKKTKFNGQTLDNLIGKESNNIAYNKRLSKSIFYALIEKDTSSLDGIRDYYANPTKKSLAIKKIVDSKLYTTSELESEKKLMCYHEDPKDLICLKNKWNLDFNDLCQHDTVKTLPRSVLYSNKSNYLNNFYYISRKEDENNLCKTRSKKKKKNKKKKKTRRRRR